MDTLYHYCPTSTFHSIIQNRSIWLSSLKLSNDSSEGRQVSKAVMRLAHRDGLDARAKESLLRALSLLEDSFDGLGFCLSEEGDLLSQWRGYAADGTGMSIGFSRESLESMSLGSSSSRPYGFLIDRIQYSESGHDSLVEPTYKEVRRQIDEGAFQSPGMLTLLTGGYEKEFEDRKKQSEKATREAFASLFNLLPRLFFLKSDAFSEEKEWRLVSLLIAESYDECQFKHALDRVIPYRSCTFPGAGPVPIVEVVLGPKHQTPINVVKAFLKGSGYGDVKVYQSRATYR